MSDINLTNKCGSCNWFEPIEGTCNGYCLRNKYGENVVCDRNHPYWQVARSRIKCRDYNRQPPTNADHIRSMTDEELAEFLMKLLRQRVDCFAEGVFPYHPCPQDHDCRKCGVDWLKQPYKEEA